jgi:hypothetical protein
MQKDKKILCRIIKLSKRGDLMSRVYRKIKNKKRLNRKRKKMLLTSLFIVLGFYVCLKFAM